MRTGLFLGTLLATALIGGTALADRNSDDSNQKSTRGNDIKERVLEKQREGFGKVSKGDSSYRASGKQDTSKADRVRPHGEIYGDQGTRGGKTAASQRGRNLSASASVNNPSEVRAMQKMINPLKGAYNTSEAPDGTDSFDGNQSSRVSNGGSNSRNLSASNSVNNPSEIKAMLKLINPMNGAYRTSQAADGCDSYGGNDENSPFAQSKGTTQVHFKNDKGELLGKTSGENKAAARNSAMRERLNKAIADKVSHKATVKVEHDAALKADTKMSK